MTDDPFETSQPEEERPSTSEPTAERGPGFPWGALIAIFGISLTVVFAVQNTEPVPVISSGWRGNTRWPWSS